MKRLIEKETAIKNDILVMHELAERSVKLAFEAMNGNKRVVREISKIEQQTDVLDTDINYACTTFIALFQPVARDLRFAISMMRISSSYERIADLAQEVSLYECKLPTIIFEAEKHLKEMFNTVRRGYDDTSGLRDRMIELDNIIDAIYVEAMEEIEHHCDVNAALTARHVERIGDLLAKIAARQIFVEEGRRVWIV
ncbi:PhoU domain-containing protein [Archaeoglobus neptunius]|uniref:PhoU domain-containing protein n=1 Tax=Archaeoglobus neptunius TaxID=2798580 RepID=UPI0019272DF1|nr:PhoU domain-containing protein [Archaeoglobus neptunius]